MVFFLFLFLFVMKMAKNIFTNIFWMIFPFQYLVFFYSISSKLIKSPLSSLKYIFFLNNILIYFKFRLLIFLSTVYFEGKKIFLKCCNCWHVVCCQVETLKSWYRLTPNVGETKPKQCPRPSCSTAALQQERVSQNSCWKQMVACICLFGTPPPFVHFCEYHNKA